MKLWEYYQPNDKDHKDNFGDCQIRALSKIFDCTWVEAFDKIIPICRREQMQSIFNAPSKVRENFLNDLGFQYGRISNKKGSTRPTVKEFALRHREGRYIAVVQNHVVAIVNGKYFDTWDCGQRKMYGYYELMEET